MTAKLQIDGLAVCAFAILLTSNSLFAQQFPATQPRLHPLAPGLHKNVACTTSPDNHCNIYVPRGYRQGTPTPVMYVFAPGGDAPAELFAGPADKLGWLVCGSVESKNGQEWEVYTAILQAMRGEMAAHFTLHPHREYFSGMSGGSRVALEMFFANPQTTAGVLAMAAGWNQPIPEVPGGAIAGIAGNKDFNYVEFVTLSQRCRDRKIAFQFLDFAGGHGWSPKELIAQSMDWLDAQYFIRSPHLADAEKTRRAKVLADCLRQLAAMNSTMPAYEACESLQADLAALGAPDDEESLKKIDAIADAIKAKITAELEVRDAFRKVMVDIQVKPTAFQQAIALRDAMKLLGTKYPYAFYGKRATALAGSLEERLKQFPPDMRK